LLLPFSYLFEGVILLRNLFYDKNVFRSEKVNAKVFSVGNITVGGTGKTPTVIYLTETLKKIGAKPGILSRGYGRNSKGYRLVFDGKRFLCDVNECGDEIILEARSCNVPAAVSEARTEGARKLIEATKVNAIVLDDAFQHRKIARDLDIVLLDENFLATASFLDKQLLPSGLLREPFASLERADVVIINRKFNSPQNIPDKIKRFLKDKNLFYAHYEIDGFYDVKNNERFTAEDFAGQRSLAVSGIAKPQSFFVSLEKLGIGITEKLAFRDHKNYAYDDVQLIRKRFYESNAYSVITTEKDAVKLTNFSKELDDIDIYYLKIRLVIEDEAKFEELIVSSINGE
jgi:tetraacyldisaccharide 4'-kinase